MCQAWAPKSLFRAPKSLQVVTAAMKLKDACSLEEKLWPNRQHIKKQRHYFANKGLSSQAYGFSSGHVWMWELDYEESWVPKNWCFWTVVLEETLESPLDCKEVQVVHPKGNQSWMFIERTDAEVETPILWPPDVKNWLTGKDPDAGKDWGQEEKGMTEDEVAGWHRRLNGHEFEQTQGDSEGQRSLACCHPWDRSQTGLRDWTVTYTLVFTHTMSSEMHNSYTNAVVFTYSQCPHTHSHVHTHIHTYIHDHMLTSTFTHTFTLCDSHPHTYCAPTFRHTHTLSQLSEEKQNGIH